mmetsp:Transcript_12347/g.40587  ORF Transcript_12347/g.40587 Transcript_12347/m.40587 type:complete len:411 (+) Transcript_12347:23-1255(+)
MAAQVRVNAVVERILAEAGAGDVWREITQLAQEPGMLDFGQGSPAFGASEVAREAAAANLLAPQTLERPRQNQYSAVGGLPELRKSLAEYYLRTHARELDADSEVVIVSSATEGLCCAVRALAGPGDEVIVFEPFFPWYPAHVALAGAVMVPVRLRPEAGFKIERELLEAAFSPRTKLVVFNSPHNPTGFVATREELEMLAELCTKHNVAVISDEVYERQTFAGRPHLRLDQVASMAERTVTLGSSSKMLNLTGWRVGWVTGPPSLIAPIAALHGYFTYCAPTPLQHGVAEAVARLDPGGGGPDPMATAMEANYATLKAALAETGLAVFEAEGGYFLVASTEALGLSAFEYCRLLAREASVVAAPMDVFYAKGGTPPPAHLVRFALCKPAELVERAAAAIVANPVAAASA